jgi:hypothetical protein
MKTPVKRKRSPESLERKEARLKAFANAYLVLMIKYSPEKAALEAGKILNVGKTASYAMLKDPIVTEILKSKIETALLKYQKSPDDVLHEAAVIAFSDIADYFEKDSDGSLKIKDLHSMPECRKAIKSIKHKQKITTFGENSENRTVENEYEYEMWSKTDMIKALMMYHKLINAKQNDGANDLNEANVVIYLPDNGYGGDTPIKGVRFGQPKQIDCEVVE